MCVPTCTQNQELAETYINFMLSDDAAIANAEYICYASPHKNVYESDVYAEDMGEDAMAILYPENFDFAQKYDQNCYKDLNVETKAYINELWSKYATDYTEEEGCGSLIAGGSSIAIAIVTVGMAFIVKKKED